MALFDGDVARRHIRVAENVASQVVANQMASGEDFDGRTKNTRMIKHEHGYVFVLDAIVTVYLDE